MLLMVKKYRILPLLNNAKLLILNIKKNVFTIISLMLKLVKSCLIIIAQKPKI